MLYMIVILHLDSIGGGQLYALRRAKYLKERNINVVFITLRFKKENIILKELEKFDVIEEPYLDVAYDKRNSIIKRIIKKINIKNNQKIIIESFDCFGACEILAKELNAKHYMYMLIEKDIFNLKEKDFYLKKLERKEVIGVSKEALRISFGPLWEKQKYENRYVNIGYKNDEIRKDEVKTRELKLEKNNKIIRIITVSRFDKTYIEEMIKAVILISKKYLEDNFELILIGDSYNKEIKKRLENKYKSTKNLDIRFLGYINPLFAEIYLNSDLFIGMGTALINAASYGCPCLAIDPRNNEASGFFGIDVFSFGYREDDKTFNIYSKIEEFMKMNMKDKDEVSKKTIELFKNEFEFEKVMAKLDSYIFESRGKIEYVDSKETLKMKVKYILYKIGLLKVARKVKNKIIKPKKFVNL